MTKYLFTREYQINASRKMVYSYISSASGLSEWFADDVTLDEDKNFLFLWDGEVSKAKMTSHKTNHHVAFEMISDPVDDDPDYFELALEENELTQNVFLKITDYSTTEDEDEQDDMWEAMIQSLKEIIGG